MTFRHCIVTVMPKDLSRLKHQQNKVAKVVNLCRFKLAQTAVKLKAMNLINIFANG